MLSNRYRGTLYVGVTSDLQGRIWEHRNGVTPGFATRYGLKRLVWYAGYENVVQAIPEEKRIKRRRREWKFNLIEKDNPEWLDLFETIDF